MSKIRIAKIAGLAVGATVAFGSFVPMAGAVTIAELQAQINALMAQLASLQGGTVSTGASITSDLTIGSTGAQVVALQSALVAQGHLVMPAGVAMGYFGSLTKAAVMKWQAANGVSATGYFGPISRAKFNASAGATGTVPGTTIGGGTVVVGVITTPGVEGSITVTENPSPASGVDVREGQTKVAVLGIKLEAKTSDIKIERIKLDLDHTVGTSLNDTNYFRKIAEKIYIMDGSTVVGSADLNNTTVVEDGADYFITISGMSYVVPKDATRILTVAIDARSNWDSDFDTETFTTGVPVEGVRGIDGAGVNQYGPSTAFVNEFNPQGELADDATLTISTNSSTPQDQEVICTSGTDEDECDEIELMKVDFRAEKDAVTITDLIVDIDMTGNDGSAAPTAYIYDGSTLIGSASTASIDGTDDATFTDIDWVVPANTTKTLSVRVDITDTDFTADIFTANVDTADVTSENSLGTAVTESGSAQGESITVRKAGLEFTLVSKSISKTSAEFSGATSSLKADFKVRIKAVGSAIEFGDTASTTYAFADNDSTLAADRSFVVYSGGSETDPAVSSSTTMVIGSGVSAAGGANSWVLGEGNTVDIDLTYTMLGKTAAGADVTFGAFAVGLERLNWVGASGAGAGRQTSTFMAGNSAWRTGTVTLP